MQFTKPQKRVRQKGDREYVFYRSEYKDPVTGKTRQLDASTKEKLAAKQDEIARKVGQGHYISSPGKTATLGDAFQLWQGYLEHTLKRPEGTRLDYQRVFNKHVFPVLGRDTPLGKIDRASVSRLFSGLLAQGRTFDRAKRAVGYLSLLLQYCVHKHEPALIGYNVAFGFSVPIDSETKATKARAKLLAPAKAPTPDIVKKLVAAARQLSTEGLTVDGVIYDRQPCAYALVVLTAATGLRTSEVRALKWEHVDLTPGRANLLVLYSCDHRNNIGNCKTDNSYRQVWLSNKVAAVLREWQEWSRTREVRKARRGRGRRVVEVTINHNPLGLVFPNDKGKKLNKPLGTGFIRENILTPVLVACDAAYDSGQVSKGRKRKGQPIKIYKLRYGWHKFRHFFATRLVKTGVHDDKQVITQLGHGTKAFTDGTYVSNWTDGGEQERAAEVTDFLFEREVA